MPECVILPTWEVPKSDKRNWAGTLRTDRAYKFTFKDAEKYPLICTIASVTAENGGSRLHVVPRVIFDDETFYPVLDDEHDDEFYMEDVETVEEMYIMRKAYEERFRKSTSKDPYVFTFISKKTGKPYVVRIDPEFFVGVATKAKSGKGSYTYFGHIVDMGNPEGTIVVSALTNKLGVFNVEDVTIKVEDIKGIFNYYLDPIPYDEGIKIKTERDEARAARQRNTLTAPADAEAPAEAEEIENTPAADEDVPEAPTAETTEAPAIQETSETA